MGWEIRPRERPWVLSKDYVLTGDKVIVSFSPDGKSILAATAGGALLTFATDTGKNLYRCEGPRCPVTSVSIRDGAALALGEEPVTGASTKAWPASWQRSASARAATGPIVDMSTNSVRPHAPGSACSPWVRHTPRAAPETARSYTRA